MSKQVLILQGMCKQYRAPLFACMYQELLADDIKLRVAYSEPLPSQRGRNDDVDLPGAYGAKIPGHGLFRGKFFWQMPLRLIRGADLVIVEHALKHVVNYPLLALSSLRLKKLGFWVHGGSLRHASSPWLRPYRKWSMLAADWIFSYTRGTSRAAIHLGADPQRITSLQNAIDLSAFRAALDAVTEEDIRGARTRLGIAPGSPVALFCGSLYPGRGIDFLVQAGELILQQEPRFHLLVLGAGPLRSQLAEDALTRPWLHPMGSIFGQERALYFRLAALCLMPYLAGLGILDAMAAGLPFIVTGARASNPEIDYLVDGTTGLSTGDSVEAFAAAIVRLLGDPSRLNAMSAAARTASYDYSIESMAANFCQGIRACLALPRPAAKWKHPAS